MIQSNANLVAVEADSAVVELNGASCAACLSGRGCGASLLGGKRRVRVERTVLPEHAAIGCRLIFECEPRSVLSAAVFGYGMPLVGLLVAGSVAALVGASEGWVVAAALSGMLTGLAAGTQGTSNRPNVRMATG